MRKYQYVEKKINIIQPDGTYKAKSVYAHSEEELEKKIERMISSAEKAHAEALKPKFDKVADDWYEEHSKEIGVYTNDCYNAPLKNLKDEFKDIAVADITTKDIQNFINKMSKKGYAKHTIALRRIVASLVFDYAILQGYVQYNPMLATKLPKNAPVKKRELPDNADIEKVKNALDKPFGLFAYLCLYTGCRRGEALALKYEDIDLKNDLISINKVIVYQNGKPVIENRAKSASGVRTIPLLEPLKKALKKRKTGYIFTNENNEPLTLSEFNSAWRKYTKATGISLTPHQLRHAFATICFDAGLEEKDTAQIMGHSKIELTMNIYTHIKESRKQESANKLNAYLNK